MQAETQLALAFDHALNDLLEGPPQPLTATQRAQVGAARNEIRDALDPTTPGTAQRETVTALLWRLAPIVGPIVLAYLLRTLTTRAVTTVPGMPQAEGGGGGIPWGDLIGALLGGGRGTQGSGDWQRDVLIGLIGSLLAGQAGGVGQAGGGAGSAQAPRETTGGGGIPWLELLGRLLGGGQQAQPTQQPSAPNQGVGTVGELILRLLRGERAVEGASGDDPLAALIGALLRSQGELPPLGGVPAGGVAGGGMPQGGGQREYGEAERPPTPAPRDPLYQLIDILLLVAQRGLAQPTVPQNPLPTLGNTTESLPPGDAGPDIPWGTKDHQREEPPDIRRWTTPPDQRPPQRVEEED